jgi:hypothetical protein
MEKTLRMPLVILPSEQSCAISYSSYETMCFTRNIFRLLFVTRESSVYRGMCGIDYRVGWMSMYKGQSDKVAGGSTGKPKFTPA